MPLMNGKSDRSFSHNVKAEMNAGKPQSQALAISYAMKRKNSKKMAKGGPACSECASQGGLCMAHGGSVSPTKPTPMPADQLATIGEREVEAEGMKMAKGGMLNAEDRKQLIRRHLTMAEGGSVKDEMDEAEGKTEADQLTDPTHMSDLASAEDESRAMDSRLKNGTVMTDKYGGYAEGGIVEQIMSERSAQDKTDEEDAALEEGPDVETAMAPKMDYSAYHHVDDAEHGNIPADEDEELVGQILRERKMRRR